ncbi:hypothetical protein [Micromonospora matsumotoense]|uniref:hypothetical protein n=1 Tax=Micromonospora matsumotoense TaxID=121616 RepID=UPI0033F007AC
MAGTVRRIGHDVRGGRNLEAYAVTLVAAALAVVSAFGDLVPVEVLWSVLLAGIALLVYRITVPDERAGTLDAFLDDRVAFDARPFPDRLRTAQELWVYAPSAVNILSPAHCDALRTSVLARPGGVVRVVLLDPASPAVGQAVRQLDDAVDFALQRLRPSITTTRGRLAAMAGWPVPGVVEHRVLDFNPGFSLVAIDPQSRHGRVIVELHGFHNESTSGRMHLEFHRRDSERWYAYWIDQFRHIWAAARPVGAEGRPGDQPGD